MSLAGTALIVAGPVLLWKAYSFNGSFHGCYSCGKVTTHYVVGHYQRAGEVKVWLCETHALPENIAGGSGDRSSQGLTLPLAWFGLFLLPAAGLKLLLLLSDY